MTGARQTWLRHRLAVLLIPLATVAVHQLRYVFAYGSGAGHELALDGDEYVTALLPGLGMLALAAAVLGTVALWRAARGHPAIARRVPSLPVLWAVATVVLLGGYLVQESLEVVLGSAHASIIGQAFADGGLWVLPAAVLVGLGWALAVRGSRAVLALALRRALRRRRRGTVVLAVPRGRNSSLRLDPGPLARRHASRAPPLVTS
jgi:hypothetical protein